MQPKGDIYIYIITSIYHIYITYIYITYIYLEGSISIYLYILKSYKERGNRSWIEAVFKQIIPEKLPELRKDTQSQIQETVTPNRTRRKNPLLI